MNDFPVSRPAQRWATSPVDAAVHLLDGDQLPDVVKARCGAGLPTDAHQLDQPPPGAPCEACRVLFLADFGTPR